MQKGNEVVDIIEQGDYHELVKLWGFMVLDDSWITEWNKVLTDDQGNEYQVLEHTTIRRPKRYSEPVYTFEIQDPGCVVDWKHSCVKLDKPVPVGTILYVKYGTSS